MEVTLTDRGAWGQTPPPRGGDYNLIKTEYWDRAGGGGDICYDW